MDPRIAELKSLLPQAMLSDWVRLGSRLVRLLRDQHHPQAHEAILSRLLQDANASVALRRQRGASLPGLSYPPNLPITARKDEIVTAIRERQVVIIAGETGSGKTTQIPKMCLEAGLGIEAKIGCTQPRRIAALSISRRIADELEVCWGQEVGCKIRFDDRSSPNTYIKLMTDGILLAETQGDRLLSEYNAIIIDEAHERSLNIDFLLGYLKGLLAKRPELKLIITSATIDTQSFSNAFNDAPIIEVSGRVYPVEVVYAPIDTASEEAGDLTYIDLAVRTAEQIVTEPGDGGVLVFMPSERDIRETRDLLQTRVGEAVEIIPLFGRLGTGEQQRAFAPTPRRKVIIATNIAETSLTIPGIRYVIDSGLARVSRYNSRTRTRRLPIEPIAQSSANQRKGRSGRVQNGVCIRLYSEADLASRPAFTQPEIQRANLAEVILRMKAFRLGEIESFAFINPPSHGAIEGGYRLLQELGALDQDRQLTGLGRDLARLPIDPTLGRMLLEAQHEHATRELLIIAAGLSIQDPRERPLDQKDAATAAHKKFADPRSDFLSLLNIWNAVHEQWESLRTQNQRRKFCKAHFLSYVRMREWQDLHAQLQDALEDLGTLRINESNAAYESIHRSILAGLLGHIGSRVERNIYQGPGNRRLNLFPGSVLHERAAPSPSKKKQPKNAPAGAAAKSGQPEWIVAGEIVETSQLFVRTVAEIEPEWMIELAPHLCQTTYHNPHWSPEAGRVLADEKTTLYGLEVRRRKVAYGNVDPKQATDIFIRSALVEGNLASDPEHSNRERDVSKLSASQLLLEAREAPKRGGRPYRFLEQNSQLRHKIETWQTRIRRHDLANLDEALFEFYRRRIQNISSIDELNRWLRDYPDQSILCATEADLIGDLQATYDEAAFPDKIRLGGHSVPLSYSYSPGEEHDGITIQVDLQLAEAISPAEAEWAVPGLREGLITEMLRALPKALRRELMPFGPKVSEIARELRPSGDSLKQDLIAFIRLRYGVHIPPSAWPTQSVPQHVRPRIEVLGHDQKTLASGRDLSQLRKSLEKTTAQPASESPLRTELTHRWERFGLTGWTFGDLPERVTTGHGAELIEAWPGLIAEEGQVHMRLFRSRETSRKSSLCGVRHLVAQALQKDLAWLQKDLRVLVGIAPLLSNLCTVEQLQEGAFANLKSHVLPSEAFPALLEKHFSEALEQARRRLPGLAAQSFDLIKPILQLRCEILDKFPSPSQPTASRKLASLSELGPAPASTHMPAWLSSELNRLVPSNFLEIVPFERLPSLARYLKALRVRCERAAMNPLKDQERSRQIAPYSEALRQLQESKADSAMSSFRIDELRWMIEEFRISVFAQELGTAMPVSPKRLDELLRKVRGTLTV